MRRITVGHVVAGALALLLAAAGCGPKGTPRMVISAKEVDMGVIPSTEPTTTTVTISNEGDGKLTLTHVVPSCPCVSGRVDKAKLAPGESTTLHITMDPSMIRSFKAHKNMLIRGTDPETTFVRLPVYCRIDPEFSVEPDPLELGSLEKGKGGEFDVILRQVREEPVELREVTLSRQMPYGVSVTSEPRPAELRADPAKAEYTIRLRVAPETRVGRVGGLLKIVTNVKRLETGYRMLIRGDVKSFYTIKPETSITLLGLRPGMHRDRVFTVSSEDPIEVTDVTFSSPGVSVTARQIDANSVALDMDIAETAGPDLEGAVRFVVRSGDRVQEEAIVLVGRRRSDDDHDEAEDDDHDHGE